MTTLLAWTETNPFGVSYIKLYPPPSNFFKLESFQDSLTLLPNLKTKENYIGSIETPKLLANMPI